jgi:hypothetical protein
MMEADQNSNVYFTLKPAQKPKLPLQTLLLADEYNRASNG